MHRCRKLFACSFACPCYSAVCLLCLYARSGQIIQQFENPNTTIVVLSVHVYSPPFMVVAFNKQLQATLPSRPAICLFPSPGHLPAHSPAMDFLREKFALIANAPGPSKTFFADIVQPRPDFEVLSTYASWGRTRAAGGAERPGPQKLSAGLDRCLR